MPHTCTPVGLKCTLCVLQESESAEDSSPGSERGSIDRGPAPQAIAEGNICQVPLTVAPAYSLTLMKL